MSAETSSLSGHLNKWFDSDTDFHHLYPLYIQILAQKHWTPLEVIKKAADFLAITPGAKILDIGSGPGKFCLGAAYYKPECAYYGIEQRYDLVRYATVAKEILGFGNVNFIHNNIVYIDFTQYDHFYLFNSFYENLPGTYKIDDKLTYSKYLYNKYSWYVYGQLEKMPVGTRIATFHCSDDEMPNGYYLVGADVNQLLKFWIKV
ncbi:methyltransferase domain-containing protein [Chitinophaga sp. 212800010-3]|uniref:methyltransferase domain-containing protein n=1 Tax=unclassified Chitinophaga TaxID=2619133 RepID=UPI002DEC57E1|nr:Methyltransferase domain-containing protein [Chitinophaga sp. 212800010-3]